MRNHTHRDTLSEMLAESCLTCQNSNLQVSKNIMCTKALSRSRQCTTKNAALSMNRIIFRHCPLLRKKSLVNQKSLVLHLQDGPNLVLYLFQFHPKYIITNQFQMCLSIPYLRILIVTKQTADAMLHQSFFLRSSQNDAFTVIVKDNTDFNSRSSTETMSYGF